MFTGVIRMLDLSDVALGTLSHASTKGLRIIALPGHQAASYGLVERKGCPALCHYGTGLSQTISLIDISTTYKANIMHMCQRP